MNRTEHLLWVVTEECHEVIECASALGKRASKAARFGLEEVQPGQDHTNAQRLVAEFEDLLGAMEMLRDSGVIGPYGKREPIEAKKRKVEEFLSYSAQCGTLDVASDTG